MSNVIAFPPEHSVITPLELAEDILERCKRGEIKHLMIGTIDQEERSFSGFSSIPTPYLVYMHRVLGMRIEDMIRESREK